MKKKLLSAVLSVAVVASLLVGCGSSDAGTTASSDASTSSSGGTRVGVSMPTKDLQRWNQDGSNMEAQLKEAGYEVRRCCLVDLFPSTVHVETVCLLSKLHSDQLSR